MMPMPNEKTLSEFARNDEASQEELATLKARYPALPDDYVAFLASANGGEGFIGDEYVILWRAREIEQFNQEYETERCAPSLLLFGSSGGGEAYAFDTSDIAWSIVRVPFIGMNLKYALPVANGFTDFIDALVKKQ